MFPKLLSFCQSPLKHNLLLETKHYYHYYHYKPCELVLAKAQLAKPVDVKFTFELCLQSFRASFLTQLITVTLVHPHTRRQIRRARGCFVVKGGHFVKLPPAPRQTSHSVGGRQVPDVRMRVPLLEEGETFPLLEEKSGGSKLLPIPKGK